MVLFPNNNTLTAYNLTTACFYVIYHSSCLSVCGLCGPTTLYSYRERETWRKKESDGERERDGEVTEGRRDAGEAAAAGWD